MTVYYLSQLWFLSHTTSYVEVWAATLSKPTRSKVITSDLIKMFDDNLIENVFIHLAMTFGDDEYDIALFWDLPRVASWTTSKQ